jgi:putative membrane protein
MVGHRPLEAGILVRVQVWQPNMQNTNTKNNKIHLFFTGLTMGIADLVPGVSGGTIAFVFGIYDELLYSIKIITGRVPKLILTGNFKQAFLLIPFSFLIPLVFGLATAIFGFVQIVSFLLETQPVLLWSFFFGLVLGSAFIISGRITKWTINRFLFLILGFILTFIIVGLPSLGGSEAPFAVFTTGAIAITAMILPGISGSLIMVSLGQYEVIINAVAERDFFVLFIFAVGAIMGLALFVRLLTWLMKNYHSAVIAFLIGVMIGSLRQVWPWQDVNINGIATNVFPSIDLSVFWPIMLAIIGFIIVFILERIGVAKEYDYINTADFQNEFKNIKE